MEEVSKTAKKQPAKSSRRKEYEERSSLSE
jgi:hypothetical protein